jgi:hypothetical protein
MLWFAFLASLLWTLLSIVAFLKRARTKLELRLTKEIFIRINDFGDSFFLNAVYLSLNNPVLVTSADVSLLKTDGAVKTYPMEVRFLGEKVRGQGPWAEHYFYSSSPLTFVPASTPIRSVYMCVHSAYSSRFEELVREFESWLLRYRQGLQGRNLDTATEEERAQIVADIMARVEEQVRKAMQIVQLEEGQYELELMLKYREAFLGIAWTRMARSRIRFLIGGNVKDVLTERLRETYRGVAYNRLSGQTNPVAYPEYNPLEIHEDGR